MTRLKSGFWLLVLSVLSISLCGGANLVIFTVVNALWLRPQPIPDADRVVLLPVSTLPTTGSSEGGWWAEGGLQTLRREPVLAAVAGQVATSGENSVWRPRIVLAKVGHDVEVAAVTSQYFSVMGLLPRGRDFTPADDRRDAPVVAIISERLWRTAFDGAADVIGAEVAAAPERIRIIGIAPPDFHGVRLGEDVDLWIPRFSACRVAQHGRQIDAKIEPPMLAYARLIAGPSIAEALRLLQTPSDGSRPLATSLIPISAVYGTREARTTLVERTTMLWLAAAASAVVFIAGCATLMALIFVHYERRRQELAIRMALGCSHRRLIGALALELGRLGAFGAAGAAALAIAGLRVVPLLRLPGGIELGRFDLSPDWRVVLFGAAVLVLTLAGGTLAPIRRATRHDLVGELVASSSTWTSSLRLRTDIVALQVAVTVVALVAAGPFVWRVLTTLSHRPLFDVQRTLFVDIKTDWPFDSDVERKSRQQAEASRIGPLLEELRALPGVSVVSLGGSPIGPDQMAALRSSMSHQWPRILTTSRMRYLPAAYEDVGPDYFDALGVAIIAGRKLNDADAVASGDRGVVVTRSFAEAMWAPGAAIDQRFMLGATDGFRVVGVVNDIAFGSLSLAEHRGVFRPLDPVSAALSSEPLAFVIRSNDPARITDAVRNAIADALPFAYETTAVTGAEIIARDSGRERVSAWFLAGFSLVALVLGSAGVFGLVAFVAESRKREMGIRLALGGMPGHLLRLTVTLGVTPVMAGTAAGLGVSAVLAKVITTTFIDVNALTPAMYAIVGGVMIVAAAAAGLAAGWRVRRVMPADVLRIH
jgi:predicted permease